MPPKPIPDAPPSGEDEDADEYQEYTHAEALEEDFHGKRGQRVGKHGVKIKVCSSCARLVSGESIPTANVHFCHWLTFRTCSRGCQGASPEACANLALQRRPFQHTRIIYDPPNPIIRESRNTFKIQQWTK